MRIPATLATHNGRPTTPLLRTCTPGTIVNLICHSGGQASWSELEELVVGVPCLKSVLFLDEVSLRNVDWVFCVCRWDN